MKISVMGAGFPSSRSSGAAGVGCGISTVRIRLGHASISDWYSMNIQKGEATNGRRAFLEGLTSLPFATVLADRLLAAAVPLVMG